jgi:hypothetical protein
MEGETDENRDSTQFSRCVSTKGDLLVDVLLKETERGLVLVAATFLDNILWKCLDSEFENQKAETDVRKRLIGVEGKGGIKKNWSAAFSDFGRKIMVCQAFGLIGIEEFQALEAVRRVRNACAHGDFQIALADSDVAKDLLCLKNYLNMRGIGGEATGVTVRQKLSTLRHYPSGEELEIHYERHYGNRTESIKVWQAILDARRISPGDIPDERTVFIGATITLYLNLCLVNSRLKGERISGLII